MVLVHQGPPIVHLRKNGYICGNYHYMQQITLRTEDFLNAIALTEEFYGINLPYFHTEVEGCPGYPETLDADAIHINTTIDLDKFDRLFTSNFGDEFNIVEIYRALLLLAIVIKDKDVNLVKSIMDEETRDTASMLFEESIRPQMLKLYIFTHSKEFLDNPQQKIQLSVSKSQSCTISDMDAWFSARMVNAYLKKFIPEITSVDLAREELSQYGKKGTSKKGRPFNNFRNTVCMLGTTHLFKRFHVFSKKLPDALCYFIADFLSLVGTLTDPEREILYPQIIRSQVRYMESRKMPEMFPPLPKPEVVAERDKERLLSKSGVRKY